MILVKLYTLYDTTLLHHHHIMRICHYVLYIALYRMTLGTGGSPGLHMVDAAPACVVVAHLGGMITFMELHIDTVGTGGSPKHRIV